MSQKNKRIFCRDAFNYLIEIFFVIPETIGKTFISFCQNSGKFTIFTFKILLSMIGKTYLKEVGKQVINIGFYSIPVIAVTSVFSGMVLTLQTYSGFSDFASESSVAAVLVIGMVRELGPIMTGLMFAGRVSSSIAAEIGTMVITEQVDALRSLNVNPYKFLVIPKLMASVIIMPVLVCISDSLGILGGFSVSISELGFSKIIFLNKIFEHLNTFDITVGLVKSICFGIATTLFGCYYGLLTQKGAKAVGDSTTRSVVFTSISILVINYILTLVFFKN